jgi:glycolate oxidase FAD binding subunit
MKTATIQPGEVSHHTGIADVREGTPADAVLGVVPAVVAFASSAEEVSRMLAWINGNGAERRLKVVPCGTRTRLDRGAPPSGCDVLLDLSRMSGVVEHAAGDLTVTARAGTRLADLQEVLGGAGQFLAIDPPVPGTIGGLVATADHGPRRLRYGGVRDLILGVTFARADGTLAKGGGKVVKNVAGYDLPKLFTGSLGTLGVILEATFRLYPLPQAAATVVLEGIDVRQAGRAAAALLSSSLVPTSLDYFSDASPDAPVLAVRFESSPRSVEAQSDRAAQILGLKVGKFEGLKVKNLPTDSRAVWERMDRIVTTDEGDVLARLISTVSDLPGLLDGALRRAEDAGVGLSVRAHMGHGHALLRWHAPEGRQHGELMAAGMLDLRREAEARGSNLVFWRAPASLRALVDVWGDPGEGLALMRRVKSQFDPNDTLNPGRFVGGI